MCRIKHLTFQFMPLLLILTLASQSGIAHATEAIDFKLPGRNGTVTLSDYKNKVIYLDFWASWCVPCRKSFGWMNAMQAKYKSNDFIILAVNLDKDSQLRDIFLTKYPANFVIAYDSEGDVAKRFNIKGMPSSYLISRDGKIVASHTGFREADKSLLESRIKALL